MKAKVTVQSIEKIKNSPTPCVKVRLVSTEGKTKEEKKNAPVIDISITVTDGSLDKWKEGKELTLNVSTQGRGG